jgi:hypothetical protein
LAYSAVPLQMSRLPETERKIEASIEADPTSPQARGFSGTDIGAEK